LLLRIARKILERKHRERVNSGSRGAMEYLISQTAGDAGDQSDGNDSEADDGESPRASPRGN
jgi:hypothetical protein